jgi:predicted metal-dependent hydrolase
MSRGSLFWTQHMHALSVLFPAWERAFAAVAIHHRPKVSSALAARIDAFAREEVAHANGHESYNRRHGLTEAEIEELKKTRIIHRKPGHKIWLGTMVSIEHLAACMSRMYLEKFQDNKGRDHRLFEWHAREEIGHKDLAMDIWRELGYSDKDLRAIARQNQAYVLRFITTKVLESIDWKKPANWLGFVDWAWWMTKKVLIPMLAIYIPRFHPNWFDDKRYEVAA